MPGLPFSVILELFFARKLSDERQTASFGSHPGSAHSMEPPYRVAFCTASLASRRHGQPEAGRASCREARVVMTVSPTDDHASAERRIQELTRELSRATTELAEA